MGAGTFRKGQLERRPPGVWIGALGCFVLAAATGALFRYGVLAGLPAPLTLGNVRHAHSHLMYFGWVTPALMALMAEHLTGRKTPGAMRWIPRIALLLGLLAYPPFLLLGYQPLEWAGRRLPLATMVAGLNILVWYAYGGAYFAATRRIHHPSRPWWDLAVFFLLLSSLGAWGRAALAFIRGGDPFWPEATVHFFLNLFADGWLTPALIGLAGAVNPEGMQRLPRWAWWALLLGAPGTFLLTIPPAVTPLALRILGGISGGMVAAALLALPWALLPHAGPEWRIPLAFLGLRALSGLAFAVPAIGAWALKQELRILYLHLLLLGFASLGLMAAAAQAWGTKAVPWLRAMEGAVLILLVTLIPLTGLWPSRWGGPWTIAGAWIGAMLPTLVALGMLGQLLRPAKRASHRPLPHSPEPLQDFKGGKP